MFRLKVAMHHVLLRLSVPAAERLVVQAEDHNYDLFKRLVSKESEVVEANEIVKQDTKKVNGVEEILENLKDELGDAERSEERAMLEVKQMERRVAIVKSEAEAAVKIAKELEEEVKEAEKEAASLEKSAEEAREKVETARARADELKPEIAELQTEYEAAKTAADVASKHFEELDAQEGKEDEGNLSRSLMKRAVDNFLGERATRQPMDCRRVFERKRGSMRIVPSQPTQRMRSGLNSTTKPSTSNRK